MVFNMISVKMSLKFPNVCELLSINLKIRTLLSIQKRKGCYRTSVLYPYI